jgi:hypothetical protein
MSQNETAWLGHMTKSASADYEKGSLMRHEVFFSLCAISAQVLNSFEISEIPLVEIFCSPWPAVC